MPSRETANGGDSEAVLRVSLGQWVGHQVSPAGRAKGQSKMTTGGTTTLTPPVLLYLGLL